MTFLDTDFSLPFSIDMVLGRLSLVRRRKGKLDIVWLGTVGNVSKKVLFFYTDPEPWTSYEPPVYLDHSPSFKPLLASEKAALVQHVPVYIEGILSGTYQDTIETIYDAFVAECPRHVLEPLSDIDIKLAIYESRARRAQHLDFVAQHLWCYCAIDSPVFQLAGLSWFMLYWHRDYPGPSSSWRPWDAQPSISDEEEEAWNMAHGDDPSP
ncbi:hypothetical protein C8J56DRAFT_896720 [Mycena floridula]|nr:hypothetical protein C8J56DRAFT_896720 [Mycena floridula]